MSDKKIPDEMVRQMNDSEENTEENGEGEAEELEIQNTEHDLDLENLEMLDPTLISKIQEFGHEDMLVEFDGSKGASADERMKLVNEWFTAENDYRADTNITPSQVYAMTMLRNIDSLFPNLELEDTQSWIDDIIDDIERYVLSVDGFARKQEENVLRALFGDTSHLSPEDRDSMFMRMLSNPHDRQDDDN